jgi:hypothetical protein
MALANAHTGGPRFVYGWSDLFPGHNVCSFNSAASLHLGHANAVKLQSTLTGVRVATCNGHLLSCVRPR